MVLEGIGQHGGFDCRINLKRFRESTVSNLSHDKDLCILNISIYFFSILFIYLFNILPITSLYGSFM